MIILIMEVKLKSKQAIAKGFTLFEFETTEADILEFIPGQFFSLTLINPPFTDNRGNSRFLGFINPPKDNLVQFVIKNGESAFKRSLMQMSVDEVATLDKINGRIDLPVDNQKPIVFVAHGIGIAPIVCILRSVKQNNLPYNITLIFINDSKEEAPFYEELESYAKQSPNFKFFPNTSINGEFIKQSIQLTNDKLFFVKGEQFFVIPTLQLIESLGVEANKISTEIFTGY